MGSSFFQIRDIIITFACYLWEVFSAEQPDDLPFLRLAVAKSSAVAPYQSIFFPFHRGLIFFPLATVLGGLIMIHAGLIFLLLFCFPTTECITDDSQPHIRKISIALFSIQSTTFLQVGGILLGDTCDYAQGLLFFEHNARDRQGPMRSIRLWNRWHIGRRRKIDVREPNDDDVCWCL